VRVSRDQLYNADEVFVCGAAAEVIGLSEIDFRTIGDGKLGRITREIQNVYHDAIRGKVSSSKDALYKVYSRKSRPDLLTMIKSEDVLQLRHAEWRK